MAHKASKSEIIYIAEADSSKLYKFDLDLGAQIEEFKSKSGDYDLTLLIGGHQFCFSLWSNLLIVNRQLTSVCSVVDLVL